jgi:hypothetical protein
MTFVLYTGNLKKLSSNVNNNNNVKQNGKKVKKKKKTFGRGEIKSLK